MSIDQTPPSIEAEINAEIDAFVRAMRLHKQTADTADTADTAGGADRLTFAAASLSGLYDVEDLTRLWAQTLARLIDAEDRLDADPQPGLGGPESLIVSVFDRKTGKTETAAIEAGNYLLITASPCQLSSEQHHINGTSVLIIAGRTSSLLHTREVGRG